jgi:hypothetical protein
MYLPIETYSSIEEVFSKGLIIYHIWGFDAIIVAKQEINQNIFKDEIDEKMLAMIEQIERGEFSQMVSELLQFNSELKNLREKIDIVLKNHLHKQVFQGDCTFI